MVNPAASSPDVAEDTVATADEIGFAAPVDAIETLVVVEERLAIERVRIKTGSVRVSTRTETVEEMAEVAVEHGRVEVTHVPIGRVIDVAPQVFSEGELTIIPVIEERMVLVKQLVLVEEIHIRRHVDHEVRHVPVALRRQHAVVERLDAEGHIIP